MPSGLALASVYAASLLPSDLLENGVPSAKVLGLDLSLITYPRCLLKPRCLSLQEFRNGVVFPRQSVDYSPSPLSLATAQDQPLYPQRHRSIPPVHRSLPPIRIRIKVQSIRSPHCLRSLSRPPTFLCLWSRMRQNYNGSKHSSKTFRLYIHAPPVLMLSSHMAL